MELQSHMSATKSALTRKHPHLPGKFHGLMVSRLSVISWNQGFDSFTDFMVSRVSLNIGGFMGFKVSRVSWIKWFFGFCGLLVSWVSRLQCWVLQFQGALSSR